MNRLRHRAAPPRPRPPAPAPAGRGRLPPPPGPGGAAAATEGSPSRPLSPAWVAHRPRLAPSPSRVESPAPSHVGSPAPSVPSSPASLRPALNPAATRPEGGEGGRDEALAAAVHALEGHASPPAGRVRGTSSVEQPHPRRAVGPSRASRDRFGRSSPGAISSRAAAGSTWSTRRSFSAAVERGARGAGSPRGPTPAPRRLRARRCQRPGAPRTPARRPSLPWWIRPPGRMRPGIGLRLSAPRCRAVEPAWSQRPGWDTRGPHRSRNVLSAMSTIIADAGPSLLRKYSRPWADPSRSRWSFIIPSCVSWCASTNFG